MRSSLLLLLLWSFALPLSAQSYDALLAAHPDATSMTVVLHDTHIYATPNGSARIVETLAPDEVVMAYARAGAFLKIARPGVGHAGYVKITHLVRTEAAATPIRRTALRTPAPRQAEAPAKAETPPTPKTPPASPLTKPSPKPSAATPHTIGDRYLTVSPQIGPASGPDATPQTAASQQSPSFKGRFFFAVETGVTLLEADRQGLSTALVLGYQHGRWLGHLRLADVTLGAAAPTSPYGVTTFADGAVRCRHRTNGNFVDPSVCIPSEVHVAAAFDANVVLRQGRWSGLFVGSGLRVSDHAEPYVQGGLRLGPVAHLSLLVRGAMGTQMRQASVGLAFTPRSR